MSDLVDDLMLRIAELERKQDQMFRPGPVQQRKKIDGEWFVRTRIGGTDEKPTLSPWLPYVQQNGGPRGLNVYRVPQEGEIMMMISPSGDPRQALLVPMFWSDEHKPPSENPDEVAITHPKFKLTLGGGALNIETSETLTMIAKSKITLKVGGSTITITGKKIGLKATEIETDGKTKLDKGTVKVLTEAGPASRVFAKV